MDAITLAELEGHEEDQQEEVDPSVYTELEVNGEEYDLADPEEAKQAQEDTKRYREELKHGDLYEYEGRGTSWGDGGRKQLLYDEVRAKMAVDYHEGKHDMTWKEQHERAVETTEIVAKVRKKQGKY